MELRLSDAISQRFGTYRGLVRLILSYVQLWRGAYRPITRVDWRRVKRLVFVCAGNVCRSPYGHLRAQIEFSHVSSIGLSTDTGRPAEAQAIAAAARREVDMSKHRATSIGDFSVAAGDLFLIMEDRHWEPLSEWIDAHHASDVQIALLGYWATPKRPLIYDPFGLSDAYFDSCYDSIDSAVGCLLAECRSVRPDLFPT